LTVLKTIPIVPSLFTLPLYELKWCETEIEVSAVTSDLLLKYGAAQSNHTTFICKNNSLRKPVFKPTRTWG
jgi:hypothetical protein